MSLMLISLIFSITCLATANCEVSPPERLRTLEEQREAYRCRQQIREVANEVRQTVEELVRERVSGFFQKIKTLRKLYPLIDALEQKALKCCERTTTFRCCEKILLEELEVWKVDGFPADASQ